MILTHHDTNFVQIPPGMEARLVTKRSDAVGWHTRSLATYFDLSLFADKRVEFSFFSLNLWPLTKPSSSSPSRGCPKRWKAEYLSPPIMIWGQKQLSPCPTGERAATIEKTVLTRSSGKRRQSFQNCFRRRLLFIFSRDDNRRVPSGKCSSSIAPKHEWLGRMYASHFSITGKSLFRFTFCNKQYTNWESSPNAS